MRHESCMIRTEQSLDDYRHDFDRQVSKCFLVVPDIKQFSYVSNNREGELDGEREFLAAKDHDRGFSFDFTTCGTGRIKINTRRHGNTV